VLLIFFSPNLGIADSEGYLFAIRWTPPLTTPGQKPWSESIMAVKEAMDKVKTNKHSPHLRGTYQFLSSGISIGGGQEVSKIIKLYYLLRY
jgi:hypothetical protein